MKTELEHTQDRMNKIIEDVGPTPNIVDWCDAESAYTFWARKAKALSKKRNRVENRRARVTRTLKAWSLDGFEHPTDVAFWVRKAIEADQQYYPQAWPVKKEGE